MGNCLFCNSNGPYTRAEHIIPQALGNDDLVLQGKVCDACNQFFGSKIENFVLTKSPLAFWRTYLGIRKKHAGLPHVDLSQPKRPKGRLPSVHDLHDNLVGFTCHHDYSVSVDIDDDQIVREILDGTRTKFTFVFTPLVLSMMGRFFCKVGMELLCLAQAERAYSDVFARARAFARFGEFDGLWPIFHFQSGTLRDLKKHSFDSEGLLEQVSCYAYRLVDVGQTYALSTLTIGTDTWVIALNDPFPTPAICAAFPGKELNLIWYSAEELGGGRR